MRYKQFFSVIFFGIMFNYSFAQKSNSCKTITKNEDSVILSLLVKYFPNDSISNKHLIINGKINDIQKYYGYLSYRLSLNKNAEIRIVNFGTYIEHNPNFMLVIKMSDNNIEDSFVLGKGKLEDDLQLIEKLFSSSLNTVNENYKLEILEIFLQSRLGVLQTKCYIH